jgi:hypothetical protein
MIHQHAGTNPDLAFLPQRAETFRKVLARNPANLDESLNEVRAYKVLEAAWPVPQHNPSVLLHGDFRLPNVLWKAGAIVAVIDWELASVGDPERSCPRSTTAICLIGSFALRLATRPIDCMNGLLMSAR